MGWDRLERKEKRRFFDLSMFEVRKYLELVELRSKLKGKGEVKVKDNACG